MEKKSLRRTVATTLVSIIALMALMFQSSPAFAAGTGRSDLCNSYVCGSGTFTFSGTTLTGAMSMKRTCGSTTAASIQIVVIGKDGGALFGPVHQITLACNNYQSFTNLKWTQSSGTICGFMVAGNRNYNSGFSAFSYGNEAYNPNGC